MDAILKKLQRRMSDVELPYVSMSSGLHGLLYGFLFFLAVELST